MVSFAQHNGCSLCMRTAGDHGLKLLCPEAIVNAELLDRLVWFTSSIFSTFFYEIEVSIMGMKIDVSIENSKVFQKAIKLHIYRLGKFAFFLKYFSLIMLLQFSQTFPLHLCSTCPPFFLSRALIPGYRDNR